MTSVVTAARNGNAQTRPFALTMLVGAAALTIALAEARAIGDIAGPVFWHWCSFTRRCQIFCVSSGQPI